MQMRSAIHYFSIDGNCTDCRRIFNNFGWQRKVWSTIRINLNFHFGWYWKNFVNSVRFGSEELTRLAHIVYSVFAISINRWWQNTFLFHFVNKIYSFFNENVTFSLKNSKTSIPSLNFLLQSNFRLVGFSNRQCSNQEGFHIDSH